MSRYSLLCLECSRILLQLSVCIGALGSLYALLESLGMRPWISEGYLPARVSSLYGNPDFFAAFLVLPMTATLFLSVRTKTTVSRCLYLALFVLQGIGVFLSGTRGTAVGLVDGASIAGVIFLFTSNTPYRYAAILLASTLAGGALVVVWHTHLPQKYLLDRFMRVGEESSTFRLRLWQISWQAFKEHPLLGLGPENYYAAFDQHFDPAFYKYNPKISIDKPHNYLAELLATEGAAGLLAYLALLALAARAFWKAFRSATISWPEFVILISGGLAYVIQSLFLFETPASGVGFYLYIGLAAGLYIQSVVRADNEDRHSPGALGLPALTLLCAIGVLSAYGVYLTDGVTASDTLRDLNYGHFLSTVDVPSAVHYLDRSR